MSFGLVGASSSSVSVLAFSWKPNPRLYIGYSYNSTVFHTTPAYGYDVFVGYDSPEVKNLALLDTDGHAYAFRRLWSKAQSQALDDLNASECHVAYDTTYQTKYGGMIMLSDDVETTTRYDWVTREEVYKPFGGKSPHTWMCTTGGSCAEDAANSNWTVEGYRVHSYLSERVPQHGKLQYSLPLTITVIGANFVKAIVLRYMSFSKGDDAPLLTTGGAVASFLHKPDRFSVGRCLLSTKDVGASYYSMKQYLYKPLNYQGNRTKWYSAVQARDWLSFILL